MRIVIRYISQKRSQQSGINMVDLMMWLVIAALLLAAAIQGIGYYQQNAYVYQMRASVDIATSRVMAMAANDGSLNVSQVDSVVADMNATNTNGVVLSASAVDVTAAAEPGANPYGFELSSVVTSTTVGAGQTYLVRASNSNVAGYDVIHTFGDTASKKSGTYLVNKGTTNTATPGGMSTSTATSTATATATATTTSAATATASPSPTVTPTSDPTPPADSISSGANISASSTYASLFTDRSIASRTSTAVQYLFTIPGVTNIADYQVTWSGTSVGKTNSKFVRTDNATNKYWFIDVSPVDAQGFTVGTSYYTATVKNIATGATSVKTWKLTVTQEAIQANSSFTSLYPDRTVSAASPKVQYVFQIPGATLTDYTVVWSGGSSVNASIQGQSSTSYGGYWFGNVVPANAAGFSVGTDTITAKVTHNGSGEVLTKTWNLNITDYQIQAASSFTALYADRSVPSMTSSAVQYVFTVPDVTGNTDAFTVQWSGAENLNATLVPQVAADKSYWFVNVTPKSGGLTVGSSVITAKLTQTGSGKVLTKTWNLNVTQGGIMASSNYSSLFLDRTAKPASTSVVQYLFTMPGNFADYSVVWSSSNASGLNATTTTTANSTNDYWFMNVTPGTGGFAAGSSTITATVTHTPTGAVYTKTWNLTVQ